MRFGPVAPGVRERNEGSDGECDREAASPANHETGESGTDDAGEICKTILQSDPSSRRARPGENLGAGENSRTEHPGAERDEEQSDQIRVRSGKGTGNQAES